MSREYLTAGRALDAVDAGQTLKAYCARTRIGAVDFALACETLKFRSLIATVLDKSAVTAKALDVGSNGVLYVMVYELLFGKRSIRGGGAVRRRVLEVEDTLRLVLDNEMKENAVQDVRELLPNHVRMADSMLRQYVRVNTLKVRGQKELEEIEQAIKTQCPGAVADTDVPFLYVLPVKAPSFGEHPLVKLGLLVIQDKASCLPSQLLFDEWDGEGDVIDACAAPGNKTTHIAAQISYEGKNGKIFALDKSARRAKLLEERAILAGADGIIETRNFDFLQLDASAFKSVRAILLDPSCSGSGVLRSLERLGDDGGGDARLEALRRFQVAALTKALLGFENVTTVAYSTCSIHCEENESVVAQVLKEASAKGWDLVAPKRLTHWKRRGMEYAGLTPAQSNSLIRCDIEDGMIGFFVAVFSRGAGANVETGFSGKRTREAHPVDSNRKRRRVVAAAAANGFIWRPGRFSF